MEIGNIYMAQKKRTILYTLNIVIFEDTGLHNKARGAVVGK